MMEYSKQSKYQDGLNYEMILSGHMANIARYRDQNPRTYASSLETLVLMCPRELREKAQEFMQELHIGACRYTELKPETIKLYDRLWEFINQLLEEHNLIFRTSYIKTYE